MSRPGPHAAHRAETRVESAVRSPLVWAGLTGIVVIGILIVVLSPGGGHRLRSASIATSLNGVAARPITEGPTQATPSLEIQPARRSFKQASGLRLPTSSKPVSAISEDEISSIDAGPVPVLHFFDRSSLVVDTSTLGQLRPGIRFRLGYTRRASDAP